MTHVAASKQERCSASEVCLSNSPLTGDVCQDRERLSVTATSSATALLCWLLAVVWNLAVFTGDCKHLMTSLVMCHRACAAHPVSCLTSAPLVWMVGQLTHTAVVHPLTRKLCSTCRRRAGQHVCRCVCRLDSSATTPVASPPSHVLLAS